MKRQPQNKVLLFIIIFLAIANVVLLGILWTQHNDGKEGRDGRERSEKISPLGKFLKDSVQFDNAQMVRYDSIRATNKREAKAYFKTVRSKKQETLMQLADHGFADSAMDNAAQAAALNQAGLEKIMLTNLRQIREICTPAQLPKFDAGFYKAMTRSRD